MFSTELVVQTFISGVMIGVLYALMALGITFIYSIMRMINWAMGEFYMIGSYLQYMLVAWLLGPDLWWLAILVSTAGVFVLGLLTEWSLLVALGVFWAVLRYTWYGLALRATSQSRVGVQTAGIDVQRVDRMAFGIGVALAGLAGALLAPVFLVFPTNGLVTTVKGFEIVVIGGLGSIPGALIAGVALGLVESFGAAFVDSAYQNIYGFALVLLILVLRPNGLFGERGREA
jgi:branched-subunit amino acid ABC-type transport system permease component